MVSFAITTKDILHTKADCLVFLVEKDFTFSNYFSDIEKQIFPGLAELMKQKKCKGDAKSHLLFPVSVDDKIIHLLIIGLGGSQNGKKLSIENLRRALGTVIRIAEKNNFKSIAIKLPASTKFGVKRDYYGKQIGTILTMACYHFDTYITQESQKLTHDIKVTLVVADKDKQEIKKGIIEGEHIGKAVNSARHWVDLPPSDLTPVQLARNAQQIAKENNLKITIFDGKKVNELGMGGLRAVSAGSDRDCRLVIMEYKAKKKNAPTIAFVGKGITFDSGGLSLKPPAYMETMKEDMSGAASVIGAMEALAKLKPSVNIIGVTPLSENLPSGKAIMPGDVIRFYNGKTAEVKNTDAEGRLVLADALAYTVKQYKPDAIIDLATLTGACQHALGPFFSGMLSNNADFAKKVEKAAELSGERVWPLPLHDDYRPAIRSSVADISNIGSKKYMAGTITAAFFLENFVDNVPWVHLDIAGTAFNVPDISYYRDGATGFGVRLLVELAMHWK